MCENQDIVNNLNTLVNVFLNEDNLKFSKADYDKEGENEENEK